MQGWEHYGAFAWLRGAYKIHGDSVNDSNFDIIAEAAIHQLTAQVTQLTTLVAAQQEQVAQQARMAETRVTGNDFELSKLGKPDVFTPYKTEFTSWEFKVLNYIGNQSPAMRRLVESAKVADRTIPIPTDPADLLLTNKLYNVLSQVIKGSALKIIRRVGHGNVAEAYRKICARWAEQDAYGGLGLVRKIMSFKFGHKLDEL